MVGIAGPRKVFVERPTLTTHIEGQLAELWELLQKGPVHSSSYGLMPVLEVKDAVVLKPLDVLLTRDDVELLTDGTLIDEEVTGCSTIIECSYIVHRSLSWHR